MSDYKNYNQQNFDQQSDYYQDYRPGNSRQKDRLATASLIFGIFAFLGMSFLLPGVICGILAAVLAGASRFNTGRWHAASVAGMILGILAVIGTFILLSMALQVLSDPEMMHQVNQLMQYYMGRTV